MFVGRYAKVGSSCITDGLDSDLYVVNKVTHPWLNCLDMMWLKSSELTVAGHRAFQSYTQWLVIKHFRATHSGWS